MTAGQSGGARAVWLAVAVASIGSVACGESATDRLLYTPTTDAGPPADTGPRLPPRVYPAGALHSPIDEALAQHLRDIAARGPDRAPDVFAKIGDSITARPTFLSCFDAPDVDLGDREDLRDVLQFFQQGDAAGASPFARVSLAAGSGWTARRAVVGRPSPLEQELDALHPRFASVMFGTNEAGTRAAPRMDYDSFIRPLVVLVDALIASGTLPLLSSVPPRDDDRLANARVPALNGLVRALAASRGVGFVDLHQALLPLPRHGLTPDGIHTQPAPGGACAFGDEALSFAANVRNLLVLDALDRLRRTLATTIALDEAVPRLVGHGTRTEPFLIPSLPFATAADTALDGTAEVDVWSACSAGTEWGPEVRYRFTVTGTTTRIAATVAAGEGAILDVHLVHAGQGGEGCIAQHPEEAVAVLQPGEYDVVVDTFARNGTPRPGEAFVFVRVVD